MTHKKKKVHTIGEDLVLPAAKALVNYDFGHEPVTKLTQFPCVIIQSKRRIDEMSGCFAASD